MLAIKNQIIVFIFVILNMVIFQNAVAQKGTPEVHKRIGDSPVWSDTLTNPLSHVSSAADSGKVTYMKICSVCHGTSGKGDGIAAAGLSVRPADHTSVNVQYQTDGSLYYEMTNGHAPMPAYKTVLTDKQRWQLVCYIRTLKPKAKK